MQLYIILLHVRYCKKKYSIDKKINKLKSIVCEKMNKVNSFERECRLNEHPIATYYHKKPWRDRH